MLVAFLLVARALGPNDFGIYATALAVLALIGPFAGFGFHIRALKDAAADFDGFALVFRTALVGIALTLVPMGLIAYAVSRMVIGAPIQSVGFAALAFAELCSAPLIVLATSLLEAREKAGTLLVLRMCTSISTLLGAFALSSGLVTVTLQTWLLIYGGTSTVNGLLALVVAARIIPDRGSERAIALPLLFRGLVFSLSAVLNRINSDVDKLMLTAIAGPAVTGVYSVAYRLANTATLVPSSVVSAWAPRIVRLASGIAEPSEIDFARVGRMSVVAGISTGIGVAALAPLISLVLKDDFAAVSPATVLLAWLPLVVALRFRDGMVLIGAERSATRSRVLAVATVINVALNLALIPRLQVYGAILATLASELVVLVSFRLIGRGILAGSSDERPRT